MCKKESIFVVYSNEHTGYVGPDSACFRESKCNELRKIKVGDMIWVETYPEHHAGPTGYVQVAVTDVKKSHDLAEYQEVYWEGEFCSGMTKVYPHAPKITRVYQVMDHIAKLEIVKVAT